MSASGPAATAGAAVVPVDEPNLGRDAIRRTGCGRESAAAGGGRGGRRRPVDIGVRAPTRVAQAVRMKGPLEQCATARGQRADECVVWYLEDNLGEARDPYHPVRRRALEPLGERYRVRLEQRSEVEQAVCASGGVRICKATCGRASPAPAPPKAANAERGVDSENAARQHHSTRLAGKRRSARSMCAVGVVVARDGGPPRWVTTVCWGRRPRRGYISSLEQGCVFAFFRSVVFFAVGS